MCITFVNTGRIRGERGTDPLVSGVNKIRKEGRGFKNKWLERRAVKTTRPRPKIQLTERKPREGCVWVAGGI